MARNPDDLFEENSEQLDEGQAQDVAADALNVGRYPTVDSEHGNTTNPAAVLPEDTPDLIDTMNQMLTSGIIDNGAFAGEPLMDDEEGQLGDADDRSDDMEHPMPKDDYRKPEQLSGYSGDEGDSTVPPGPAIRTKGLSAEENRGRRAPQEGSGVVIGSGASAGGGGAPEDFDDDVAAGGGAVRIKPDEKHPVSGADAPVGGSR